MLGEWAERRPGPFRTGRRQIGSRLRQVPWCEVDHAVAVWMLGGLEDLHYRTRMSDDHARSTNASLTAIDLVEMHSKS